MAHMGKIESLKLFENIAKRINFSAEKQSLSQLFSKPFFVDKKVVR